MRMVSSPPRIRVSSTSRTESRIMREASRTISIVVPGGILLQNFDLLLDPFHHPHRIRPGLFQDVHPRAGMPFTQGQGPLLLDAIAPLARLPPGDRASSLRRSPCS